MIKIIGEVNPARVVLNGARRFQAHSHLRFCQSLLAALVTSWICVAESSLAQNWTATRAPTGVLWTSVASSTDGTRLVAAVRAGPIFTSTNSGFSWVANEPPSLQWRSVAFRLTCGKTWSFS